MGKAYRSRQCKDYQTIKEMAPATSSPEYPEFSVMLGEMRETCDSSLGGSEFLTELDAETPQLQAEEDLESNWDQEAEHERAPIPS